MSTNAKSFSDVVIRASAGTGKTFQLSNRFIGLVADGRPQDAILASTFTRKAAGEILQRVLSRLAHAALDDRAASDLAGFISDKTIDRRRCLKLLRELVRQLHRLRVGTLDQFFMQIAHSFSLELALPPAWRIIDEVADGRLRAAAIREVLAAESTDDAVRLMNLLTKGDAGRSISQQISVLVNELYNSVYLEAPPAAWESLQRLKMPPTEKIAARLIELEAAALPADKRFVKARDGDIERFRGEQWEEFIAKGLAAKVLDGSFTYYGKEIPGDVVEIYQLLVAHAKAAVINMIVNQTQATFDLLERFDRSYRLLKTARGAMRFEDVTRCLGDGWTARHIDAVLYRLDSHLLHMLLDEFQDTSLLQWQVLRPFAHQVVGSGGGRSFFCVGDVKQAIYGWRGGVAEIFEAIDRELGGLEHKSLDVSYRSSRPVIDTVNRVFSRIVSNPALGKYASAAVQWGGRFGPHDTARSELSGYCRMATAPRAEADQSQTDVTISYTADEISRMKECSPGADIGVLVRKNDTVRRLIHELRRRGLEASEEGGNPLTDSPAVVLILSLLRIADHPGDTPARFHLANSTLGRALGLMRHDDSVAARRLAADVRARLMADGYGPTIDDWTRILAATCDRRDLSRLAQLVELAYGYELDATSRPGDFVELVEKRRVEDPTSARLRVMTVHQAKGLQFDIVVLPELDTKLHGQPSRVVVGRKSPTEPICHICRYVSQKSRALLPDTLVGMFEEQERREIEEALCILYVSLTRPVHALQMIVNPSRENEKSLPSTFAGVLRGALCEDTKRLEPETTVFEHGDSEWFIAAGKAPHAAKEDVKTKAMAEKLAEKPLQFNFAATPTQKCRGLDRRSPSQLEGGSLVDLADRLRLDTGKALGRGTLIHAWFEQITWLEEGQPDDEVLQRIARRQGFPPDDVPQIIAQFRRSLARPAVRDALSRSAYEKRLPGGVKGPRWQVWQERPFAIEDGDEISGTGGILSGMIDRMVVLYDDGRPLSAEVIDFKTDAVSLDSPDALAARVEVYRPQLEAYRRAAAALTGLPPERIATRLLFTEAGCVREV